MKIRPFCKHLIYTFFLLFIYNFLDSKSNEKKNQYFYTYFINFFYIHFLDTKRNETPSSFIQFFNEINIFIPINAFHLHNKLLILANK